MATVPPPKRHPYNQWAPDARALDLVGDKWTLLIVRDLAAGPRRFVELQRVLPGISTEQLRSRLNRMVADGLLTRQRYREVPPRVDYELTERARDLLPVVGALARWGYRWAWGPPRPGEAIDIGAIFRSRPRPARCRRGVTRHDRADGPPRATATSSATCSARPATALADRGALGTRRRRPKITGSERAWIEALGPDADRADARDRGRPRLADALLDGLSATSAPRRAGRLARGLSRRTCAPRSVPRVSRSASSSPPRRCAGPALVLPGG